MDDAKRKEIEGKVINCKLKISNEKAKLERYETQLAVGKTGHTKARTKTEQKQGKTAVKPDTKPPETKKEKGFFETILS